MSLYPFSFHFVYIYVLFKNSFISFRFPIKKEIRYEWMVEWKKKLNKLQQNNVSTEILSMVK